MLSARADIHKAGRILAVLLTALLALLALFALASCGNLGQANGGSQVEGPPRDTTPAVLEVSQPGTAVMASDTAILDYSNASQGYVCVMSNLEGVRFKVLVDVAGTKYQYTIDTAGSFITIPLSQGSGSYQVGVWQNTEGDLYSAVFSQTVDAVLSDEMLPFLYPNQYVHFAAGDAAADLSQQLSEGSVTDVDALNNIYYWVCQNIDYDTKKATTVASGSLTGYLPTNADTIKTKQGICFDYAVLTASMLRAQRVPAKLVIGYAGAAYHAWMEVYCTETGSVLSYTFNGTEWVRMDPTFDAASGGSQDLSAVIGDGTSYAPLFYY